MHGIFVLIDFFFSLDNFGIGSNTSIDPAEFEKKKELTWQTWQNCRDEYWNRFYSLFILLFLQITIISKEIHCTYMVIISMRITKNIEIKYFMYILFKIKYSRTDGLFLPKKSRFFFFPLIFFLTHSYTNTLRA